MGFTQLHLHTNIGSPLDGVGASEQYVEKAKKYGHKAMALSDHGSMSGIYKHQVECIKGGVKPIIGIEVYINDQLVTMEGKKRKRTKNCHLTLLAKNKTGYKNLCNLNYISNNDTDHFYYSPRITQEELFEYKEGIIVGSGCLSNPISKLLRSGKEDEAISNFNRFVSEFGEDFFVEIHLNELVNQIDELPHGQKDINDFFIYMANKEGVPITIVGDVHFLDKGDDKIQTIAFAIRDKVALKNLKWEIEAKNLYYHDIDDYVTFNDEFGYDYDGNNLISWCNNTVGIAEKCNYELPKRNTINTPTMTTNDDYTLIKKSMEGLAKRFSVSNIEDCPDNYKERLEEELKVLIRKGFSSYLLVVTDISEFSERERIWGRFGRGSVAGSLVAYALNIHNVDPLKHDLLFSRFLSAARSSDLILDYIKNEYCIG